MTAARSGSDPSSEGHMQSIVKGFEFILENPMGVGPGNAGSYSTKSNVNGVFIEDTYMTLAAEYGIIPALIFIGFIASALWLLLKNPSSSSFMAAGILVGFATVMVFAPLHQDFPLASWIWFPVGYAIRKVSVEDHSFGTLPHQSLMPDSANS
jgi:O-antigen ligase